MTPCPNDDNAGFCNTKLSYFFLPHVKKGTSPDNAEPAPDNEQARISHQAEDNPPPARHATTNDNENTPARTKATPPPAKPPTTPTGTAKRTHHPATSPNPDPANPPAPTTNEQPPAGTRQKQETEKQPRTTQGHQEPKTPDESKTATTGNAPQHTRPPKNHQATSTTKRQHSANEDGTTQHTQQNTSTTKREKTTSPTRHKAARGTQNVSAERIGHDAARERSGCFSDNFFLPTPPQESGCGDVSLRPLRRRVTMGDPCGLYQSHDNEGAWMRRQETMTNWQAHGCA